MNSGQTAERVYDAIKRRIMAHEVRPGDRLDPAVLAVVLASSVTPVRDALHILSGEGLVEAHTSGGFHAPAIDEPGLADLFAWAAEIAMLAVRAWPRGKPPSPPRADAALRRSPADWADAIFVAIANHSPNAEHHRATEAINARLHAARKVEAQAMGNVRTELQGLVQAIGTGDRAALRKQIAAYCRKRQRLAAEIVRALYRAG